MGADSHGWCDTCYKASPGEFRQLYIEHVLSGKQDACSFFRELGVDCEKCKALIRTTISTAPQRLLIGHPLRFGFYAQLSASAPASIRNLL